MHILYFHQYFSTPQGRGGTRSYEMAKALLKEGHNVTMVCSSYDQAITGLTGPFTKGRRRGDVEGIDVIEFNINYTNDMGLIKRAIVFVKFAWSSIGIAMHEPADIVFATTTPLTAGIPGIFARWFRRKPFVFEVRDLWPELPKAMGVITNPLILSLMSILEWASYRSAHRLIGLSPGIVAGIESRGVDPTRITMVPNGCDMDLFAADIVAWRPEGVTEDTTLAVFTGTHGVANGLDAVLDAAAILKERGTKDICIALIGQGKEKKHLQKRAKAEDLDNILFLDSVPKTHLAGLMAGADVGLQVLQNIPAFYFGTSPNKFFDYISAGLPVINNYPGWIGELIQEHDCGYLVRPDDPTAFADALIKASQERDELKIKGQNALSLAQKHFSRETLSQQWVTAVTAEKK